jgi:drug/metabolite transporter (DMT)-like permease
VDRRRAFGVTLVVVSAVGFGSGTVLSKPIYAVGLDWLQLLSWRFMIGAGLAWAWVVVSPARRAALRSMEPRWAIAAAGLGVWYAGNAGTYYAGLETVPASLAGVLVDLYPAIVAVLSIRFATRLSGRRPWAALAIAMVGVVLALGGIPVAVPPPLTDILLILASPLIYAGWIVLSARLAGERTHRLAHEAGPDAGSDDAAATTALMITAAAVVFTGGAIVTARPLAPASIPPDAWPFLLAIGFSSTFIAIQAFYAGARRIGAAQAALLSTIEPLVIITLAAIVLHDVLAPIQLLGAAMILVGVIVAQTGNRATNVAQPVQPIDDAAQPGPLSRPEPG